MHSLAADGTLRFERVSTIQRTGFANRQHIDYLDTEALDKDPMQYRLRFGRWMWKHNPGQYALENYEDAVKSIKEGTPFQNTNLPADYVYEPWTIGEEMENENAGKRTTMWDTGVWYP